jgi:flagellar hook-basal body complex protein FliE
MTAPIGYPEKFGVILEARRELQQGVELKQSTELGKKTPEPGEPTGPTFGETLKNFVSGIDGMQKQARTQSEEFAVGKTNDIHNTMIDVEQAEISLRMLANVRNRVVDLYREVMRMGS